MSVKCSVCSEGFDTKRGKSVHRSMVHGKNTVKCDWCGCEFERCPSGSDGNNYCSDGCFNNHQSDIKSNRVEVPCSFCGELLQRKPSVSEENERLFCDQNCYSNWQSEHRVGEKHHQYDSVTSECANCGDDVTRPKSKIEAVEHVFCSDSCHYEFKPKYVPTGQDHPQWKEGYENLYGRNWTRKRKRALKRDKYRCFICGMSNSAHETVMGTELHVHHDEPIRDFDVPENGNYVGNLLTVCQYCHIAVERGQTTDPSDPTSESS